MPVPYSRNGPAGSPRPLKRAPAAPAQHLRHVLRTHSRGRTTPAPHEHTTQAPPQASDGCCLSPPPRAGEPIELAAVLSKHPRDQPRSPVPGHVSDPSPLLRASTWARLVLVSPPSRWDFRRVLWSGRMGHGLSSLGCGRCSWQSGAVLGSLGGWG